MNAEDVFLEFHTMRLIWAVRPRCPSLLLVLIFTFIAPETAFRKPRLRIILVSRHYSRDESYVP